MAQIDALGDDWIGLVLSSSHHRLNAREAFLATADAMPSFLVTIRLYG